MKRTQATMQMFFKKQKNENDASTLTASASSNSDVDKNIKENQAVSTDVEVEVPDVDADCYETNDIGQHIDKLADLSDKAKCDLIERPWQPPFGFKFPFSVHNKKGKEEHRYLHQSHLDNFKWLVYSKLKKGLYCKYCALFLPQTMGGSNKHVQLQKLVTKPLITFSKLLGKDGDLITHQNHTYHKNAVENAKHFLRSFYAPEENILNKISSERLKQVEENRERLKPIVESIIFLGKQNIPLRGHRDSGKINFETSLSNEGNFRELLRYRANSGDKILENHLKNSGANATYISSKTQNELIECCGEEIVSVILNRIETAKFYSIMFDETTDVSHISQLSLILSYVYNNEKREDFITFLNVHDECFKDSSTLHEPKVTGIVLGQLVLKTIKKLNLDLHNCVGIATDGCSMMVSEQIGAVAEIKKEAKYAVRCPCYSHALNLSISKSSAVSSIRNSLGMIREVASFFNASAKRNYLLLNVIDARLKGMCETRWVERNESLLQFVEMLEKILEALELMSEWNESITSSKAKMLLRALKDVEFIISLYCQLSMYSLFLPLTRLLQKKNLDLSNASDTVRDLINVLKNNRAECEREFSKIYSQASEKISKLNLTIELPRLAQKQKHRSNVPCSTPEEYYRISVYNPMLDSVIIDLESRFSKELLSSCEIASLLPKNITKLSMEILYEKIKIISLTYAGTLQEESSVLENKICGEVRLWKEKWCKTDPDKIPIYVGDVLAACDVDIFTTLHLLFKILLTLPVSTASAERSFSTLRRLKTYLRNRIDEERLTGLALLHIHREIIVDTKNVIELFAKKNKRRLEFVL